MCTQSGSQFSPCLFIPLTNICIVKTTITTYAKRFLFTSSLMGDTTTHFSSFSPDLDLEKQDNCFSGRK